MPQKFLHRLADENLELQRQLGRMPGIFQIFGRRHLLMERSRSGNNNRTVSPGHIHDSKKNRSDHSTSSPQHFLEKKLGKNFPMESTKSSFSSSSYPSFSSYDCDKSTPKESKKCSSKLKHYESDVKQTHYKDLTKAPIQSGSQSSDFRNVVKESIDKNCQVLPLKTLITEEMRHFLSEQKDSPKPTRISMFKDGSLGTKAEGKSQIPVDLNGSYRMLDKFKSTPESKESTRLSFDGRESHFFMNPKGNMSKSRLPECPRLSLDSRISSPRRFNISDTKQNSILDNLHQNFINGRSSMGLDHQQDMTHHKCLSSLVVNLMGLETMPNMNKEQLKQEQIDQVEEHSDFNRQKNGFCISNTSTTNQDTIHESFIREPMPPKLRSPDATSGLLEEPTPRRHSRMMVQKRMDHSKKTEYVYREMEERLTKLEFNKSNKDLRALKQVIDSIKAKDHLQKMDDEQTSTASVCSTPSGTYKNSRAVDTRYKKITTTTVTTVSKGSHSPRAFESPIVIMKPSTSVTRSELSYTSIMPLKNLRSLWRLCVRDPVNKKTPSVSVEMVKDRSPKHSFREPSTESPSSVAKGRMEQQILLKKGVSTEQVSGNSVKCQNSIHTGLHNKKIDNKNKSTLLVLKSEKLQNHSANRCSKSVSPRNRPRQKPVHSQVNIHQFNDTCSEARNLSHQVDEMAAISDGDGNCASQVDWSIELNSPSFFQQDHSNSCGSAECCALSSSNHMKLSCGLNEQASSKAPKEVSTEQPSQIPVPDASVYQAVPILLTEGFLNEVGDNDIQTSASDMHDIPSQNPKARCSHKRLEKVDELIQKLRQLSPKAPKVDHIFSLCETKCPEQHFVYETLLASGILIKDLNSELMTAKSIQLCASPYLINPELFFVLEKTKSHWKTAPEGNKESTHPLRYDLEKQNRKLLLDLVNELLKQKLKLKSPEAQLLRLHQNMIVKFPSGQCFAKELCDDIKQLKAKSSSAERRVDVTTTISSEDTLQQIEGWVDFCEGLPSIVMSIERLIFTDLIEDLIDGVLHGINTSGCKSRLAEEAGTYLLDKRSVMLAVNFNTIKKNH